MQAIFKRFFALIFLSICLTTQAQAASISAILKAIKQGGKQAAEEIAGTGFSRIGGEAVGSGMVRLLDDIAAISSDSKLVDNILQDSALASILAKEAEDLTSADINRLNSTFFAALRTDSRFRKIYYGCSSACKPGLDKATRVLKSYSTEIIGLQTVFKEIPNDVKRLREIVRDTNNKTVKLSGDLSAKIEIKGNSNLLPDLTGLAVFLKIIDDHIADPKYMTKEQVLAHKIAEYLTVDGKLVIDLDTSVDSPIRFFNEALTEGNEMHLDSTILMGKMMQDAAKEHPSDAIARANALDAKLDDIRAAGLAANDESRVKAVDDFRANNCYGILNRG